MLEERANEGRNYDVKIVGLAMIRPLYEQTTLSHLGIYRIYTYCMYKIIMSPGKNKYLYIKKYT